MPSRMCVACDTVALRLGRGGRLEVLLIQRGNEPFQGGWALPGGFVEIDEDLPDAAARELEEETGLRPAALEQVGAWGAPGRDPRGRTISVVYLTSVSRESSKSTAGDDAARAEWFPLSRLPELAFDHAEILAEARRRLEKEPGLVGGL